MRDFFYVKPLELALFSIFGLIYVVFQIVWSLVMADSASPDLSKILMIGVLTLTATLYAVASMWFAWRTGDQGDRPVGLFLVKQGLAMAIYICIGQILAVALEPIFNMISPGSSHWYSPNQGIPVMYTLCLGGFIGIVLAGIGADMLWKNKREAFLAQGAKRR